MDKITEKGKGKGKGKGKQQRISGEPEKEKISKTIKTLCGYELADIRRSFRDAVDIGRRDAAYRWTAEMVATPGAVGSLWASYWLAWASVAGGPSPCIPLLLHQGWGTVVSLIQKKNQDWREFRNDAEARSLAADLTTRLLDLPHQTPLALPSREQIRFDISNMKTLPIPDVTEGPIVNSVWKRSEEPTELRIIAGHFLAALERGEVRMALSAIMWSLSNNKRITNDDNENENETENEYQLTTKRGPLSLSPKQQASPIWFWLELGRAYVNQCVMRSGVHRGWATTVRAIQDAFEIHWRRWTATDRMKLLLAWVLQIRAAAGKESHDSSIWIAKPFQLTLDEIDRPYREIQYELQHPDAIHYIHDEDPKIPAALAKKQQEEARLAEADAKIMALMGITPHT